MKITFLNIRPAFLFASLVLGIALNSSAATYKRTIPPGSSLIANHLDIGGNTLREVIPVVPNATQLFKWDRTTCKFEIYTFDDLEKAWIPAR